MVARPALPNLDTLPPQALKALIHAQHQTLTVQAEEIRAQREQLRSRDEQLAGRQAEIERLQLLIAKLRRMQFGRVTTGRTGHRVGGALGGFPHPWGDGPVDLRPEAGATAAAGSSAAAETDDSA
jgi:hypothetical protein